MGPLARGRLRPVVGAMLVAASLGGAILGVGGGPAGAATSVTRVVHSRCSETTDIPHMQECTSVTLLSGRTESDSSGDVSLELTGRGTITVGTYDSDPAPRALSTGKYFGVSIFPGDTFTSLAVKDCNIGGGVLLDWWNGDSWLPVTAEPGSVSSTTLTCIDVTLGAESSPSIATIARTSRLSSYEAVVFGVK